MDFLLGDIVRMKKPHPCGSYDWEILRVGMEFRIRCIKCGRLVALPRTAFVRGVKKVVGHVSAEDGDKRPS